MFLKTVKKVCVITLLLALGFCVSDSLAVTAVNLSNNDVEDTSLSASSGNAVWQTQDPNGGDWEIVLYSKDPNKVLQLTNNEVNDVNPVIAGKYVAWEVWDGNDWEICVYNDDKVIQITDNQTDDVEPQLSAPYIFWRGSDGNDIEIYKAKLPRLPIPVICKITPESLNLKSKGNAIDAMLFLPKTIKLSEVDTTTILLQGQLTPIKTMLYTNGNIVHMKFSRSQLQAILQPAASVKLTITLYLKDGTKIMTSDTIKVLK